MLSARERDYLERLRKRQRHLERRVAQNPHFSFDRAEASAIRWAIEVLIGVLEPGAVIEEPAEEKSP